MNFECWSLLKAGVKEVQMLTRWFNEILWIHYSHGSTEECNGNVETQFSSAPLRLRGQFILCDPSGVVLRKLLAFYKPSIPPGLELIPTTRGSQTRSQTMRFLATEALSIAGYSRANDPWNLWQWFYSNSAVFRLLMIFLPRMTRMNALVFDSKSSVFPWLVYFYC